MKWPTLARRDAPADVILLLEGTYPMVRGGVASWVDQLIRGLPDLRFAVVFIGGRREEYHGILYERPANLVHLECHYLMENGPLAPPRRQAGNPAAFADAQRLHASLDSADGCPYAALHDIVKWLGRGRGLSQEAFLYSHAAWEMIVERYHQRYTEPSFIDYFWSVRNMHAPLFHLAQIAHGLPRARCLHATSTGYAGILGALAHHLHGLPLSITEHGIYTKERQIDLIQANWLKPPEDPLTHGFQADAGYLRQMWIRFFRGLGHMTYAASSHITTLYEGNRQRQLKDGAEASRTRVIPNGINIARFAPLRAATACNQQPIVVLMGRVTPIKDIKTFIRAMHQLITDMPEAEGWIAGPESEDPHYARECHELVEQLGLQSQIRFLGFQRTEAVLAEAQLVVLTSISEAQPLVILEAMAAGIPVICSDVGACREMVLGGTSAEPAAGRIVPIASPQATAQAMRELLQSPSAREAARSAGIERVEAHYSDSLMLSRYRQLYHELLASDPSPHTRNSHGRNRLRTA